MCFEDLSSPQEAEEAARRRITKQISRRGYTEHLPTSRILRPMLAHRFQDHASKLPEKVIMQPKLEGYRCLGSKNSMLTRTNSPLPAFPQIAHCLSFLPDDIILDGEIYNHGTRFQTIMKSRRDMHSEDSLAMEYHVYDCVEPSMPYSSRRVLISEVVLEMMDQYEKSPFLHMDIHYHFLFLLSLVTLL